MKEFFKKAWKIILIIVGTLIMLLGLKRNQDNKKKKEFEESKDTLEKDIAKTEGKEEIISKQKEETKAELEKLKEEAKEISKLSEELDKSKEDDIEYLKNFVKKYGN